MRLTNNIAICYFVFGVTLAKKEAVLKTVDKMSLEERVSAFGYDPLARKVYIGTSPPIWHRGEKERFEFYYNASTKSIDVCYAGCNGTYMFGSEISDTMTNLPPNLNDAFFELKNSAPIKNKQE